MAKAIHDHSVRTMATGLCVAVISLSFSACPGPDRLTDPVVSQGGKYFDALDGSTELSALGGNGGTGSATDAATDASSDAGLFDWGRTPLDKNGGLSVTYQDHSPGEACLGACHDKGIRLGGTVYQTGGTAPASNVEIGVWLNGTLFTSYAGSAGNFFTNFLAEVDWSQAQIAVRNEKGTLRMSPNPNANGNCNSCHNSGHRIVVP